jgi:HPt (histidine-containing phosphotransfer) domain-containing protein
MQTHLAAIQQACEQGNAEQLRRTAHALKSVAAQLGALTLSLACQQLENHAAKCHQQLYEHRAAVEAAFAEVRDTLTARYPLEPPDLTP